MGRMLSRAIDIFESAILAGGIICLSVLLFANVIAREAGRSFVFGEEISYLITVLVVFFGISFGARKARHIRMGALFDLASEKNKKIMTYIIAAGTGVIMFYLAYVTARYTLMVAAAGVTTVCLLWPYWVFIVWAPLGFTLTGIQYVRTIIKNVKEREVWLSPDQKSEYIIE